MTPFVKTLNISVPPAANAKLSAPDRNMPVLVSPVNEWLGVLADPLLVVRLPPTPAPAANEMLLADTELVTAKLPRVPTEVNDDVTTVDFSSVPVKVSAAAVTVIGAEPSKLTPLIARGVARVVASAAKVAVAALPVQAAAEVAVAALPVHDPELPVTLPVTLPTKPFGAVTVLLTVTVANEAVPVDVKFVCDSVPSRTSLINASTLVKLLFMSAATIAVPAVNVFLVKDAISASSVTCTGKTPR